MPKPISYLTAICLSAVLFYALPCCAGERGTMHEGLSFGYRNIADNAPASVEFNFANSNNQAAYGSNANLLQATGKGYYQRESRGRTTAGRIMAWTGSALSLAGAIMIASTDWKDPADRPKRIMGIAGFGAGAGLLIVGLTLSGDKVFISERRPMFGAGRGY